MHGGIILAWYPPSAFYRSLSEVFGSNPNLLATQVYLLSLPAQRAIVARIGIHSSVEGNSLDTLTAMITMGGFQDKISSA